MNAISPSGIPQESNPAQAFLPIVATLFFAFATAPILLGWQPGQSAAQGITRNSRPGEPILLAQCILLEHQQPGRDCPCGRN